MSEDEGNTDELGNAIAKRWKAIPPGMVKYVGAGVTMATMVILIIIAFLKIPFLNTMVREAMDTPTRGQVDNIADQVQTRSEDQLNTAIELTAGHMIDSAQQRMRHENDSLFAKVSEDLIEPGINKLNRLEENVRYLNKLLNVSNELLTQQTNANRLNADRLSQMQQQMNGAGNDDKLDAILRKLEEQQTAIDEIKKYRNSKQKF